MNETPNLGLTLTPETTDKTFKQWRMDMNGNGETDSNMTKIDNGIGKLRDDTRAAENIIKEHFVRNVIADTSPSLPYAIGINALNYKIYGNSVQSGDITTSVGTLVTSGVYKNKYRIPIKIRKVTGENLFDFNTFAANIPNERKDLVNQTVTITNADYKNIFGEINSIACTGTNFKPNTQYTFSVHNEVIEKVRDNIMVYFKYTDGTQSASEAITEGDYSITSLPNKTVSNFVMSWFFGIENHKTVFSNLQIREATEVLEYVPYSGESEDIDIYLAEPLRKNGDNIDYIDYNTQKVYRHTGEEDITLPPLPLNDGTNNIIIKTTIRPSNVEIEYYQNPNDVMNELRDVILLMGANV